MLRNACLFFCSYPASLLLAQGPPPGGPGRGNATPPKPAYQVHSDGTVTFELRAPGSHRRQTVRAIASRVPRHSRRATTACGASPSDLCIPAIYSYTYLVNGVRVLDPFNPMIKLGERDLRVDVRNPRRTARAVRLAARSARHRARELVSVEDPRRPPPCGCLHAAGLRIEQPALPGALPAARLRRHRAGLDR